MTTTGMRQASTLLPRTGPMPGERLWGEAPRKQPIAPMIAIALLLLLVAAPNAMSSSGRSGNPVKLMEGIAMSTYELTGLMQESNEHLADIDTNTSGLVALNDDMMGIAKATKGMENKTIMLNANLAEVGASVGGAKGRLTTVDTKLGETAAGMGTLRTNVDGSLKQTQAIVSEFSKIDRAISAMSTNLNGTIKLMAKSGPLTKAFATNTTVMAISGGNAAKYHVPNLAPNNRVMGIVLAMTDAMQNGKLLPARKDRHVASNILVDLPLKQKVPDGVNVAVQVLKYDGTYGLPGKDYFVNTPVAGF